MIATTTGLIIAAGIAGGSSVASGIAANKANNKAAQQSQRGTDAQLAFMREQAAEDQRRYEQQIAMEQAQWQAKEAQRAPYRQAGLAILANRFGGQMPGYGGASPSQVGQALWHPQPQTPVASALGGYSSTGSQTRQPRLTLADLMQRRG